MDRNGDCGVGHNGDTRNINAALAKTEMQRLKKKQNLTKKLKIVLFLFSFRTTIARFVIFPQRNLNSKFNFNFFFQKKCLTGFLKCAQLQGTRSFRDIPRFIKAIIEWTVSQFGVEQKIDEQNG